MTISKKQFAELTGEDPADVLGNDWKNEVQALSECKNCGQEEDHVCNECDSEISEKTCEEYAGMCYDCSYAFHKI